MSRTNESEEVSTTDLAHIPGVEGGKALQEHVGETEEPEYEPQVGDNAVLNAQSVAIEVSPEVDDGEVSDAYEPPEAHTTDQPPGPSGSTPDLASATELSPEEGSGDEMQEVSTTTPITHPISNGMQESKPASPREVDFVS